MEKITPLIKTYNVPERWKLEVFEIKLNILNVRHAKKHKLLKTARQLSNEMIISNMELCGFDIISIEKDLGTASKVTTKCCNIDCENTSKKRYQTYITNERLPLCATCMQIIRSINRVNRRRFVAIKGSESIEFDSSTEAGRQLKITPQNVYNLLKSGGTDSSGYRFEFLD